VALFQFLVWCRKARSHDASAEGVTSDSDSTTGRVYPDSLE
jgi:hypothetical protein